MHKVTTLFIFFLGIVLLGCQNEATSEFTSNEISIPMIGGQVNGNSTSGILTIKERIAGTAQIEIIVQHVLPNAVHPIHLHYGSLEDDGNVATLLNELREVNGTGRSVTLLTTLENGQAITYQDLVNMDGSIKIHFEASGPLENALIASTNIGINQTENGAYLEGSKSITECNDRY